MSARRPRAQALRLAVAGVLLAAGAAAASPLQGGGSSARSKHVTASLLAESESLQPGRPIVVGVRLQMDEGWHTYWKNPADSGLPTRVRWRLPEGFSAGPIQWPYPRRIPAPPLVSYGYEGEVLLLVEISAPASLAPGSSARLAGRVDWLECREVCLPGRAELELVLPVRAEAPRVSGVAGLFRQFRRQLPLRPRGWGLRARAVPGALVLGFRPPDGGSLGKVYFFAAEPQVVDYARPQRLRRSGGGRQLELPRDPNGTRPLARLSGVLVAERPGGLVALEVDVPVSDAAAVSRGLPAPGILVEADMSCAVSSRVLKDVPFAASRRSRSP